jgi:hypothetical protein
VTPQEHYDEAEELLGLADLAPNETAFTSFTTRAQVHATLALAGFTRDLPYDLRMSGVGVTP